jgi:diphosphomevalonate decarboxylase
VKKSDAVRQILGTRLDNTPRATGSAYAPANIALCKYWGKRDAELNLPQTSSLSISLGKRGATTELKIIEAPTDQIILNGKLLEASSGFSQRLLQFINLFRPRQNFCVAININSNIPIAAGLASSAAGFASITKALADLLDWKIHTSELSLLARLGSGSAARSVWDGFVEWHAGSRSDGMDSVAEPLLTIWPEFCLGLVILDETEKKISSRDAMQHTVATSPLYSDWPRQVALDLALIKDAITTKNFTLLGLTAEANASAMHATMQHAVPPINYSTASTTDTMKKVWNARAAGVEVYFTQDAGPNLKLLFLAGNTENITQLFPACEIIQPFC